MIDVRLWRSGGPWSLDGVGSLGGTPPAQAATALTSAAAVLDQPRIELTDTARWDIMRGDVEETLLRTLAGAVRRQRIGVSVLRTGHPRTVWATTRVSAHSGGYAADVYSVSGTLVVRQRAQGRPAHPLAQTLVAGGPTASAPRA